jgi:endonuclease/exonuclease/phosphatase (EEP) superfamily protein YafD
MMILKTILQTDTTMADIGARKAHAPKWAPLLKGMVLGMLILQASGCVKIPEQNLVISHRNPLETKKAAAECPDACPVKSVNALYGPFNPDNKPSLNADGFRLVSWNIYKGKIDGWSKDLKHLSRDTDIIILQEAYLSDQLKEMLRMGAYHWDMTAAFEYHRVESGVLTASRTAPNFSCAFRAMEPIIRIPKSVLITRYPMSGTDRELLVANIHGVNFTLGHDAFIRQAERLEKVLAAHTGPTIVSGDFNTWNPARMARVNAMAERLGLVPVRFKQNRRAQFLGQPIDHVYYRGLEARNAAVPDVATSDHNPLMVEFRLADEPDTGI